MWWLIPVPFCSSPLCSIWSHYILVLTCLCSGLLGGHVPAYNLTILRLSVFCIVKLFIVFFNWQFHMRIWCRSKGSDFICGKYFLLIHQSGGIIESLNWIHEPQTLNTRILVRLFGSRAMILHGLTSNSNYVIQDWAKEAMHAREMLGLTCPLWFLMKVKVNETLVWIWNDEIDVSFFQ